MRRSRWILICALVTTGCAGGRRLAEVGTPTEPARAGARRGGPGSQAEAPSPVVAVLTVEGARTFRASGFFVAPDRVVTCGHAVEGHGEAWVQLADGRQLPVQGVLTADREHDLVLLAVAPPAQGPRPLSVAAEAPAVGERLSAVGCHLGREPVTVPVLVTRGEHRLPRLASAYHAQGAIGPGSSGGPLLDDAGRVRGVVVEEDPAAVSTGLVVPARSVLALRPGPAEPMAAYGVRTAGDPDVQLRRSYEKALQCLRSGDYEGARRRAEGVYAAGRGRRSLYSRAAVDVLRDSLVRSGRSGEAAARLREIAAEGAAPAVR